MVAFYEGTSSSIKINRCPKLHFLLSRLVYQGCPLSPYLFILVMNLLIYMMDDPRHNIHGLVLLKGTMNRNQTFVDDTTLFFKGSNNNFERTKMVLRHFSLTSRARINCTNLWPFGPPCTRGTPPRAKKKV